MLARREELREQMRGAKSSQEKEELREQINNLGNLFMLRPVVEDEDELIAQWERELEEGQVPDLDREQ